MPSAVNRPNRQAVSALCRSLPSPPSWRGSILFPLERGVCPMRRLSSPLVIKAAALLAAGGLAASALAQSAVIIAPAAPPPPRIETVPAPATGMQSMTWTPGHWSWNGANWVWTDGQYVARPQPAARWMPGHWEQQASGGYVWVDGSWQG